MKRPICSACFDTAERHGFVFLGGHPMAGTHKSGFRAARADLFAGQPMVLVAPPVYDPALISRAQQALIPAGFGSFSVTTPEMHDKIIAYTSQLAHVVSSAFIKSPTAQKHRGFSAGSYKDLTLSLIHISMCIRDRLRPSPRAPRCFGTAPWACSR